MTGNRKIKFLLLQNPLQKMKYLSKEKYSGNRSARQLQNYEPLSVSSKKSLAKAMAEERKRLLKEKRKRPMKIFSHSKKYTKEEDKTR